VNSAEIVSLCLAGGFVLLALYGKYRKLKDDFRQAREEEALRRESSAED